MGLGIWRFRGLVHNLSAGAQEVVRGSRMSEGKGRVVACRVDDLGFMV